MYRSLIIILFAAFLALCLVFHNAQDAAWNVATTAPLVHPLGVIGSYTADFILQIWGVGSFVAVAALFFWGVQGLFSRRSSILNFIFSLLLVVGVSANAGAWPLVSGHGGLVGRCFEELPKYLLVGITVASLIGLLVNRTLLSRLLLKTRELTSGMLIPQEKGYSEARVGPSEEGHAADIVEIRKPKKRFEIRGHQSNQYFSFPSTNLLIKAKESKKRPTEMEATHTQKSLERVLREFGVNGKILDVRYGPVVTLYELEPSAGTKSSRVIGLSDDIARSMSALSTRIATIPGHNLLGIELPNRDREIVFLRDVFETKEYKNTDLKLPMALGKSINGEPVVVDLTKMPHLLVAGTTGSGKSVAINTMILSLVFSLNPTQCKMIMIDPKMLELSVYDGIPHLLAPVVTDPKKAITALKWVVREMENRYKNMSALAVRNIIGYNEKIKEAKDKKIHLERVIQTGFDKDTGEPNFERIPIKKELLPYMVVVVDEMADLMLVAGKDIECSIQRLAQMARAAGIHIIMATQRPSVDVITGVIKANFPTRISFAVTSKIDSRTILGEQGAEQLLGMGDMLYMMAGGRITRVHGPFVSDAEVQAIVDHLKAQGAPNYMEEITKEDESDSEGSYGLEADDGGDDDLYRQAVSIVLESKKSSTSYVQRQLRIGYNRAANLIERMEKEGVLSSPNNAGKREILAD